MPWWGWVLVGFGGASALLMWVLARAAALGDRQMDAALRDRDHRATDVAQWSDQRWLDEATKIVDELKRIDKHEDGR